MCRRLVLATLLLGLAVGFAGCSETGAGEISMTPVDDAALADRASRDLPPREPELRPLRETYLGAIRNGSATVVLRQPFHFTDRPVEYDGSYYEVNYTTVGETRGYAVEFEVDFDDSESAANRSVVAFADLPAVDRARLRPLLTTDRRDDEQGFDVGTHATYTTAEAEQSELVPGGGYDAVRYDGAVYRLRVSGGEEVTLRRFRYEADRIADSASAYADRLTERYAFTLSGLSENETDVVTEALNDTYVAESSDDDAFRSVLDRFRARPAVERADDEGSWLARYDGQLYWVDVRFSGFVTTGPPVTRPSATPPPPGG